MGFLNIFKKNKPLETKSASVPYYGQAVVIEQDSFLGYAITGEGRVTPTQAMKWYRSNSALATAVDMIAVAIEQIRPVLKIEDDMDNDAEVLALLQQPNGFETQTEFLGKLARHYLLTRMGYLLAFGKIVRPPLELYTPKPQLVSGTIGSDGYAAAYSIESGIGQGNYVRSQDRKIGEIIRFIGTMSGQDLRELYPISGFSSRNDDVQADSPLEAAALEVRQQIKGKIHNVKLLEGGARPSLLVHFKDDGLLDPEEARRRKDILYEQLGGAENAGAIATLNGPDIDIRELGRTNKDMDYSNLDEAASKSIYLRFGIPLPLVSTDASTYNNVENAIIMFYEHTVIPLYDTLMAGVTKMLLPRYKMDSKKARITYNPETIKPLMSKMLNELKLRKDIGVETVNELREFIPHREEIKGGNVLYQNANLLPIGSEINPEIPEIDEVIADNKRFYV